MESLLFVGLSEQKAKETLKNSVLTGAIGNAVKQCKAEGLTEPSKAQGNLLYQLCTRIKPQIAGYMPTLVSIIASGGIRSEPQLSKALDFLIHNAPQGQVSRHDLEQACGAGVTVTTEQIEDTVSQVIEANRDQLLKSRYSFPVGKLLGEVKKSLEFADGSTVKKEVDLQVLALLGPKTAEELMPQKKGKGKKESADSSQPTNKPVKQKTDTAANGVAKDSSPAPTEEGARTIEELMKRKVHFHAVGENFKADGYVVTDKTMQLLSEHVKRTGGKVRTRFPPEPNGILHIGHAKAININFGYAKAFGGSCNLRYDDTNPEKEEEKFFVNIRDMVEWLGYKPSRVTHSSDNFDQLFEWAVQLIKQGQAYVCHQQADEIKGFNPPPSPWRDRSVEENLTLFYAMRAGKFDEGEATLRLKLTLDEGKQDPVAYRIKYTSHPKSGDKWCIYPTYDYTHCLCDSLEDITHSLCTKEFQTRRSSYYWLCNAVGVYCPVQWEYGRLNVNYTVVSKRKIAKLITEGIVSDWDDPRLFTLTALRRRGFPPEAINNFVAQMGVTMAQTVVDPVMIESHARDVLNTTAPRVMAVLHPIRVRLAASSTQQLPASVSVADFPAEPDRGEKTVPFDTTFYIDADDFKETADKSFKRLTSAQPVGLKYVGLVLHVEEVIKDANGRVRELVARAEELTAANKPKGFIQWVTKPVQCQVRLYDRLFRHKNPEDPSEVPGGFLTDCNKDSMQIVPDALVDGRVRGARCYDKFQFERIGYFSVDLDSTHELPVFNRTLLLKEDSGKSS